MPPRKPSKNAKGGKRQKLSVDKVMAKVRELKKLTIAKKKSKGARKLTVAELRDDEDLMEELGDFAV